MTADSTRTESTGTVTPLLAGILLGIAGFAGNWFRYPLFLNIDFLFGGFFVMTALMRYGTGAGIVASLIASSCTWLMWNHPYAVIIFTAETAIVGFLNSRRRKSDLLLHDMGYWLICGAPLVWIFYHLALGDSASSTNLIIVKQALNGVTNSLLASIFHLVLMSCKKEAERPSLQQTVFIIMVSLVLFSPSVHVFGELRSMKSREDVRLAEQTERATEMTRIFVARWLAEHHRIVISLAERIGDPERKSFQEMQQAVEILKGSSTAFWRIGVVDRNAMTVAFAPVTDEFGRSTLGVSFADRPYLKQLKEQRKPYVSAVLAGKIGKKVPVVPLIAPMFSGGRFTGYCTGAVQIDELAQYLKTIVGGRSMNITILDQLGQVVASSRDDLAVMTSYAPQTGGSLRRVTTRVEQWIPAPAKGRNLNQRWAASLYLGKAQISPDSQWTVVVESAYRPVLAELQRNAVSWLFQLLMMAIIIIPVSSFISFRLTRSLRALQQATISLPDDVRRSSIPELPESNIQDINGLMTNFRAAALALQSQHQALTRSEELIRIAKEEWEQTFDSVPDLIAILDSQHTVLRLNRAMAERLGRTPEECIGLACYEVIHGTDCPPWFCPHARTMDDGKVHETDLEVHAFGGEFLVTTSPLYNQQGEIYATVHMARDISALKQAHKKAEKSAAELESIFSAIQDAILLYDTEMNVTKVNQVFVATYGFDPVGLNVGEMVARTNCRRLDGQPFVLGQQPTPLALQGHTVRNQRFLVTRNDGSEMALETSSTPLRLDDNTISGVVTVWHDITDALRDQRALREKEERYRTLVEYAPFAIFVNRDSRIEYANPATLNLFGADSPAAIVGKSPFEFFHPEYHSLMTERITTLLSGGSVPLIEARVVQLDGTVRHAEVVATAFVDRHGVAIQVMLHDITLRKQSENEIQIARERLQKAHDALEMQVAERTKDLVRTIDSLQVEMAERLKAEEELRARERLLIQQSRLAAMGEMISNIAHQWRQPLNTLGLIIQRLPHFYDAGKFDREFLGTSTRDAMNLVRHMSDTIDDFRDFFRPDRERTVFNVKKAVLQAISLVDAGFKALNIDLETRIEGEPTISGYPSQFSQVVLNLLFNARDALIEHEVTKGLIRIEGGREGERLVLTIRDNAGGIPDAILDRVFDPYFTTKGPDRGTGIGLFMAKSIIEKSMGGRITACNHADGAEFRIEV